MMSLVGIGGMDKEFRVGSKHKKLGFPKTIFDS